MSTAFEKPAVLKWPVTINIPRDGGRIKAVTRTVHYELIPQAEFSAIYKDGGNDEDLLRKVVVGWGTDMVDANNDPVPFSEDELDSMIDTSYVRIAFVNGYLECSSGKAAARKNSR